MESLQAPLKIDEKLNLDETFRILTVRLVRQSYTEELPSPEHLTTLVHQLPKGILNMNLGLNQQWLFSH